MIVFNQLGNLGRLGNQLFQLAATIAHAQRTGEKYQVNKFQWNSYLKNPINDNLNTNFDEIFEGQRHNLIFQPQFNFEPIPLKKNLLLNGFFQSERYFDDCKDTVASAFTPSDELMKQVCAFIPVPGNSCAIHIRRGDYLEKPDFHPVLSMNYYIAAMQNLCSQKNIENFYFFSDDMPWVKENFQNIIGPLFIYSNHDEIFDLYAGAWCKHHILANSSFSWWQAWLSRIWHSGGIHYAPDPWFGPKANNDTRDLYFNELIKIKYENRTGNLPAISWSRKTNA